MLLDNKLIVDHSVYQIDGWTYDNFTLPHGVEFIFLTVKEEKISWIALYWERVGGILFPLVRGNSLTLH